MSTERSVKSILITGMGRSGTSLVTQWFKESGLFVGDSFRVHEHVNPNSSHEDYAVRDLHLQIMKDAGVSEWLELYKSSGLSMSVDRLEQARQLVEERSTRHELWSFKDPLASLVLDDWDSVLDDTLYIFVYRHYADVVDSVVRLDHKIQSMRRNKLAGVYKRFLIRWRIDDRSNIEEKALESWIYFNESCLNFSDNFSGKRSIVWLDVDELIDGSSKPIDKLKAALNDQIDLQPFANVFESGHFSARNRHNSQFVELEERANSLLLDIKGRSE